ncbi:MAG: alpha/beta fold hydrolase [Actinomycetota bacterium]
MAKGAKKSRTSRPRGALGWALGAAALGAGAGIAVERLLVGRDRARSDPMAEVDYGEFAGDRRYDISSFDGAVLAADEVGPERAVSGAVFLHGFCLDRTIWHHQIEGLDGRRRFVFYDARDHGESRGGKAEPDTRTLARDLKALLDHSGLKRVVLVGHSMGGMTALEYCREHPDEMGKRIKGLVLLNTTYTDAVKTLFAGAVVAPVERRLRGVINRLINDPRGSRALRIRGDDLSWALVKVFGFGPKASPKQVEFTQRLLTSFPSPPLIGIMRGLRDFDMEEALTSITVPALIVAGGDDRITTVRASERMAEDIPNSRLVVFERAGHMAMMERYEDFNGLLSDFFDETLRTRPKSRTESADGQVARRKAAPRTGLADKKRPT